MPYELSNKLVVAISSRALFDLDDANRVFVEKGLDAYRAHQIANEEHPLRQGTGYPLVKALLSINQRGFGDLVEVVLLSRNDADTGLRVMNSVETHGLRIERAAFTDGRPPFAYLKPLQCHLFLSANEGDVVSAIRAGFAAALVYRPPRPTEEAFEEVRIAFDGDAVLFSPDAEKIYRERSLAEFHQQEKELANAPMAPGPFKGFVEALHALQQRFPEGSCPIRTALVTARSAPAHKRAIKTLRSWNIRLDEFFFLGGVSKQGILEQFRPHIFFDDQSINCDPVAPTTPTARVPTD